MLSAGKAPGREAKKQQGEVRNPTYGKDLHSSHPEQAVIMNQN
jgi:hypothetical protein